MKAPASARVKTMTAGAPPAGRGSAIRYRPAADDDGESDDDENDDDDDDRSPRRRAGNLTYIAVESAGSQSGRVGVHVDGGAEYAIKRRGGNEIVITLSGTRADSLSVRRVLDARTLDGRVLRVLPTVDDDREQVTLTVELLGPSKFDITEADGMLWLGFVDDGGARKKASL